MATFMEHVVYADRWVDTAQHGLSAAPDTSGGDTIPGERRLTDDSPRTGRKALLTSIVAEDILPRLARIRRRAAATAGMPAAANVGIAGETNGGAGLLTTDEDSVQFVGLLLRNEASAAIGFIDVLLGRGATPASLYLGIITRAAHKLGELWDDDRCDFAQVTISMGRLQQVLRALSPHFQMDAARRPDTDTVLLAPAPGEQHTFGLVMLAEFFHREGWHVAGGPVTSAKDAACIVRGTWIDVVGFSIGSMSRFEGLAHCIRSVRQASRNPNLYVMVGGPLILSRPDLVLRAGADAAATDAAGAVRQANGLLAMRMAAD